MSLGTFGEHFTDVFPYEVSVEPYVGSNDYGAALYGSPVVMKCQIEEKVKLVRDLQGNERASNTTLHLAGGPIDAQDRITFPTSYKGPRQPPIINASNYSDKSGFDHCEVYL